MNDIRIGRPPDVEGRRAALRATRDLIRRVGAAGVSMSDVAAAASVPRASLYRWWGSRHALIADCVLEDVLHLDLVVVRASGDLERDLDDWVCASIAVLQDAAARSLFGALLAAAATDERAAARMTVQFVEPLQDSVRGAVEAAGRDDGDLVADAVVGAMLGVVVGDHDVVLRRLRPLMRLISRAPAASEVAPEARRPAAAR